MHDLPFGHRAVDRPRGHQQLRGLRLEVRVRRRLEGVDVMRRPVPEVRPEPRGKERTRGLDADDLAGQRVLQPIDLPPGIRVRRVEACPGLRVVHPSVGPFERELRLHDLGLHRLERDLRRRHPLVEPRDGRVEVVGRGDAHRSQQADRPAERQHPHRAGRHRAEDPTGSRTAASRRPTSMVGRTPARHRRVAAVHRHRAPIRPVSPERIRSTDAAAVRHPHHPCSHRPNGTPASRRPRRPPRGAHSCRGH